MPHIVLVGDSIFDNAAYVDGGPDVATHLRAEAPAGWRATLLAIDGALVGDVGAQIRRVPRDATHLILSAGGNDALGHIDILDRPASSFAEVLDALASIVAPFEKRYRAMLADAHDHRLPLHVCTIYNGALPEPALQRRASTALALFNDAILRSALAAEAPVIELRHICTEPADYANPIEPSVQGGLKIARAIIESVQREMR